MKNKTVNWAKYLLIQGEFEFLRHNENSENMTNITLNFKEILENTFKTFPRNDSYALPGEFFHDIAALSQKKYSSPHAASRI